MTDPKSSAKYRARKKEEGRISRNYYLDQATVDAIEKMKIKFSLNPSAIVNKAVLEYAERHSTTDTGTDKVVTLEELSDRINRLKEITRNLAMSIFQFNPEDPEKEKIIKKLQALNLKPKELKTIEVYSNLDGATKDQFSSFEEYCSFIFAFKSRIRKKGK